jgi:hypothetical protein
VQHGAVGTEALLYVYRGMILHVPYLSGERGAG